MILDSTNLFDASVALTVSRVSTDQIDLSQQRDLGIGNDLLLVVMATTPFTAGGAATLVIDFQGSVDNVTYTTYASSPAMSVAQVNSGYLFPTTVPRPFAGSVARPRFLRLNYTVATGPYTAGAILAGLVLQRDDMIYYPSGYSTTNV